MVNSPDMAKMVARTGQTTLLLAAHARCGQVVLPWLGPVEEVAERRYLCGAIRQGALTVVVTAGRGTSEAPPRYRAPPDLWPITLGPETPL